MPAAELIVKKGDFSHHPSLYLSEVERRGVSLIITNHGRPVVRIAPEKAQKAWDLPRVKVKMAGDENEPILPAFEF